jgi:hypothetical protein
LIGGGVSKIKIDHEHHSRGDVQTHAIGIDINPLPALTLQNARDLNAPCLSKRFKALLL